MQILKNLDLKDFNTFGISVTAKLFSQARTITEVKNTILYARANKMQLRVLGGGSNILLTHNTDSIFLFPVFKGIRVIEETEEKVLVEVEAGMVWHNFVLESLKRGWFGLENLALIPGHVGAAPIQNIGAYGVEVKSFIDSVNYIDIKTVQEHNIGNVKCRFGYRDSIFKNELKDATCITSVVFSLSKVPNLNTSYGAIEAELQSKGITNPTPMDVCNAVINIRQSKLPNPKLIGNAGSFFKNPVLKKEEVVKLKERFPDLPTYPTLNEDEEKVAAGWLIEQAGWKGKMIGNCGVHDKQALVLINKGGSRGGDILKLSRNVIESVNDKFGIKLTPEVNVW